MRKSLLLLAMALGLTAYAQDPVLTFAPTNSADCMDKNSGYTGELTYTTDEMVYTIYGFNNNNLGWATNPIRCGRKGAVSTAYVSTNSSIAASISRVDIDLTRIRNINGKDTPNSITLKVSDSNDFSNAASYNYNLAAYPAGSNTAASFSVEVTDPAPNKYYQVYFDLGAGSGNGYIGLNAIKYYGVEDADALPVPVITLGENNTVSITAEDGLDIYYNLNSDAAPTTASTKYTAPFTISGTTTVKAITSNGSKTSSVVTSVLKPNTVDNLAQFIAAANTSATKVNTPLTAIYQNGRNLYVKDAEDNYILVYNSADLAAIKGQFANNGDVMSFITGTYKDQNGLPELIPTAVGEKSTGAAVEPVEIGALDEVATDMLNHYVRISNVSIAAASNANTYVATDEFGNTIDLYNTFYNASYYDAIEIPEGEGFTVTGFVSCYKATIQITPIAITGGQVMETVATPTFNPESGTELNAGDEIAIECATEGASIHYTIDGTEPTEASPIYDGTILFDGDVMTVKAIAVKEGFINSEVASATYTLYVEGKTSATFNFNDPSSLNPAPEIPTAENTQIRLSEMNGNNVFSNNAITLTFSNGINTSNDPVIIYPTGSLEGKLEGRCYINNTLTFKATNAKITKITFTQQSGSTTWAGFTSNPEATINGKEFTYSEGVSEVELTSLKTNRYVGINVEYVADGSAIDSVIDTDSENAPVEYFNLQGIRVNGDNLTPGIYVRRQGNNVAKVMVR